MGQELSKFARKLTPEIATWAVQQIACNRTCGDVAKDIYDKYFIRITPMRVNSLIRSKKWYKVFEVAREEYYNKIKDYTGIDIAAKRTRLQEADKLRNKLSKLVDKLDRRIGEAKVIGKYELALLRELRYLIETYFKALEYGHKETTEKDAKMPSSEVSLQKFLQSAKAKVIDAEVIETPNEQKGE